MALGSGESYRIVGTFRSSNNGGIKLQVNNSALNLGWSNSLGPHDSGTISKTGDGVSGLANGGQVEVLLTPGVGNGGAETLVSGQGVLDALGGLVTVTFGGIRSEAATSVRFQADGTWEGWQVLVTRISP